MLKLFIRRDLAELHRNGVRVRIIGDRETLQPDIRGLLEDAEKLTDENSNLTLVIAFNYGSRDEIVRAARALADAAVRGEILPHEIGMDDITRALDTKDIPDPDLVIRTSGELRLSNFLLWQAAYSELVFVPCYWPDFDDTHLAEALRDYAGRERRFGGLSSGEAVSPAVVR